MPLSYGTAKGLRRRSTDAEQLLWRRLRNRQLADAKFRRQQPIGPYVVDLICMELRLVIEVDGGQHAQQLAQDQTRTDYLRREGYRVLRFWNNDVLSQTESVLQEILEALAHAAHPSPQPSPPRGEGVSERS